ncbi:c-type cytochrome [Pseudomonas panipatensis]|uniref:Cytochrome c, mono-and diheme variants n=1 Tax=Pseudomonas panipatensis TaxID=428992 RepID=A0A1G8HGL0_9PSED|nr:c-type cytochrome [Pseudomonas panipatensis]SDI05783.1 Cytochrome c, mono-and diheme variants [Pseudomonas panipatensis]SMP58151.1 Cytochrome c, mono-and diheme variants [Pseudomonas panipatensis]
MRRLLSGFALSAGLGLCASALAADAELIQRGEYLARAADCEACHTAPGGAPFAGGLALASPFGVIYGSNITPDKEHGIGDYSADDFYAALTQGKRRDGANLYPAMPYTAYRQIERADADAILAYLQSLAPVHRATPETRLDFPFNLRLGLSGWNLLYAKDLALPSGDGKSAAWQRGQYLVEVLGHCGECHTPRNVAGALRQDQRLSGGVLNGYLAPSLLAGDLAARGWNPADLASFLEHGMSAQGSMFSEMFAVQHHSTRHLQRADLDAMATYLLGEQPPPARVIVALAYPQLSDSAKRGRQQYLNLCAGCHGVEGEGKPHIAVAMQGNTSLRLADARNLLRVVLDGIAEQPFGGFERMQPMPAFADKLDDAQLTDLLNYLRQTWGGLPGDLDTQALSPLKSATAPAPAGKVM